MFSTAEVQAEFQELEAAFERCIWSRLSSCFVPVVDEQFESFLKPFSPRGEWRMFCHTTDMPCRWCQEKNQSNRRPKL